MGAKISYFLGYPDETITTAAEARKIAQDVKCKKICIESQKTFEKCKVDIIKAAKKGETNVYVCGILTHYHSTILKNAGYTVRLCTDGFTYNITF